MTTKLNGRDQKYLPGRSSSRRNAERPASDKERKRFAMRIEGIRDGTAFKVPAAMPEAALRIFDYEADPATVDDIFLCMRKLGFDISFSSVRNAVSTLEQDGLIEKTEMPSYAVRPGPRSSYFRVSSLGKRMLKMLNQMLDQFDPGVSSILVDA